MRHICSWQYSQPYHIPFTHIKMLLPVYRRLPRLPVTGHCPFASIVTTHQDVPGAPAVFSVSVSPLTAMMKGRKFRILEFWGCLPPVPSGWLWSPSASHFHSHIEVHHVQNEVTNKLERLVRTQKGCQYIQGFFPTSNILLAKWAVSGQIFCYFSDLTLLQATHLHNK